MPKIKPKVTVTKTKQAVKQVKKLTAVSMPVGKMKIKASVSEYQNKKYLDIRMFYADKESGEFKPTQKGVAIPLSQAATFLAKLNKLDKSLDFSQFEEPAEAD